MRIVVAQLGARRHYAIPAMLSRAGLLERLETDLCADWLPLRLLSALLPGRWRPAPVRRLLGRRVADVPSARIHCAPGFACRRLLAARRDRTPDDRYRSWVAANREFCQRVAARSFGDADTVYVFNGAGLEVLERARRLGLRTVVEQTSAPVEIEEALLAEERRRWPGWEFDGASRSAWQPMADRERAEWELADVILCGSDYVYDGIEQAGGPASRAAVVPYGVPPEMLQPPLPRTADGELHVLFAGTICLRKGIPYLLEAAQRLCSSRIRFRAVGPVSIADAAAREVRALVDLPGAVPRSAMRQQYAWADVFVMPSISEGSANVCYEALGCGLPVITTHNAGSVVRDGLDGFLVPIRDPVALAERIEQLAADPDLRRELAANARQRADEFVWERYQQRLLRAIAAHSESAELIGAAD